MANRLMDRTESSHRTPQSSKNRLRNQLLGEVGSLSMRYQALLAVLLNKEKISRVAECVDALAGSFAWFRDFHQAKGVWGGHLYVDFLDAKAEIAARLEDAGLQERWNQEVDRESPLTTWSAEITKPIAILQPISEYTTQRYQIPDSALNVREFTRHANLG
jgi:hypothetical protein